MWSSKMKMHDLCSILRLHLKNSTIEKWMTASIAGANDAKDPPVPIPNTVVKLGRAEDTWLETTWENR